MDFITIKDALLSTPIRILLVDDSPYFLEAARGFIQINEALEVAGIATNGEEAVTQARQLHPDLLLLDMNLGGQSGLGLIPQLKQHAPQTKIIVLTILDDESYRAASLQAGADAFVHKSEMSQALLPVIFELMDTFTNDDEPARRD